MDRTVFLGFDDREQEAYQVCEYSILRNTKQLIKVRPLKHMELRKRKLLTRPWKIDSDGVFWDERDGKPFSTAFSHSRFLTIHYARQLGVKGWALFADGDMLVKGNIGEVFDLADQKYAVMCVKHEHVLDKETTKMDGQLQQNYKRKNWSSFVLWNLDHEANDALTLDMVNYMPGSWLHAFSWLPDDLIGSLPIEWNYLLGYTDLPKGVEPKLIHFTSGIPLFKDYGENLYAEDWRFALCNSRKPTPLMGIKLMENAA